MSESITTPKDARAVLQSHGSQTIREALANPANFERYQPVVSVDEQGTVFKPFPVECLPPPVRSMVEECARVLALPPGLPAACCLAVVSASLGSGLRVRSINGKTTPANIMVLVAAETGSGKSEAFRECMAPFCECQRLEKERWQEEVLPFAKAEARLLAKEIKKRENDSDKPGSDRAGIRQDLANMESCLADAEAQKNPPYFHASDFTTAQLIKLLCRMRGQLFAASPDAKNFVDMVLGRYNEGGTDEEVYLKAFSLEPIDRHRVGDGSQETPEACIAGLWLTQPDKLERLLAERSLSEGGLLPRLLMMQCNCPPLRVSLYEHGVGKDARNTYHELVAALFAGFRMASEVQIIDAEMSARKALVDYHNTIADRREIELRDVSGFAARWGEYAWRLALVIHAARLGEAAGSTWLSIEDAEAGMALADWFADQQLEVLHHGRLQGRNKRHSQVMELLSRSPVITARDVYRANITPRDRTEIATALLEEMVTAGMLQMEERPTERKNHIQRVYRHTGNH